MAVHWSYAFGNEAVGVLTGDMGWTVPVGGGTGPSSAVTHTYPGSPTRYSMSNTAFRYIRTPPTVFIPEGWLAMPIRCATDWYTSATNGALFELVMASGKRIYGYCSGIAGPVGTISCFIDTTPIGSFTLNVNTWYYLAVKYKVNAGTWSTDVYINGVITAATGTSVESSETVGSYGFGGFSDTGLAYIGQMIVYDWAGTGQEDEVFVTRCDPLTDRATSGTWTPSTGVLNYAVIDSPLVIATYTQDITAAAGHYVECRSSPLTDAAALNLTGVDVHSITCHDYSEGVGVTVRAAICDSGTCVSGDSVTPSIGNTSYAFSTSDTQPSGGAWQTASSVIVRHELV